MGLMVSRVCRDQGIVDLVSLFLEGSPLSIFPPPPGCFLPVFPLPSSFLFLISSGKERAVGSLSEKSLAESRAQI